MKHTVHCNICGMTANVNGQGQIDAFGEQHRHDLPRHEYMTGNHLELDESAKMPVETVYTTKGTNFPDVKPVAGSAEEKLLKAIFGETDDKPPQLVEEYDEADIQLSLPMAKALMRGFLSGDFSGNKWKTVQALADKGMINLGRNIEITAKGKQWCEQHRWEY